MKPSRLQKRLWVAFIFLLKFIALALPLHLILWTNLDTTPIQSLTAQNTYHLLKLFGQDVTNEGIMIYTSTFIFEFVRDCTAWKSILAFSALVIATPFVAGRSRLIALSWGIPSIYLINLVRTTSTIYLGIVNPASVEIVHSFLWREGLIAIIFVMWFFWFRYSRKDNLVTYSSLEKFMGLFKRLR